MVGAIADGALAIRDRRESARHWKLGRKGFETPLRKATWRRHGMFTQTWEWKKKRCCRVESPGPTHTHELGTTPVCAVSARTDAKRREEARNGGAGREALENKRR